MQRIGRVRRRVHADTISVGGLALAALGLVLFAASFLLQNPVPLTVRGSIIVFIAVGIAVSTGLLRVSIRRTSTAAWR